MLPEQKNITDTRFFAVKTTIKNLLLSEYLEGEDQKPSYLLTLEQQKIFRFNILATVVNREQQGAITNFLIDDGTEKIILRFFEENKNSKNITIGDVLLIIGRVRTFRQEKYISPEVVKKINPLWLKVRFLELKKSSKEFTENPEIIKTDKSKTNKIIKIKTKTKSDFEEEEGEFEEENLELPNQKLKKLISELDTGSGVFIEEIIEKSSLEKTEQLLEKMLETGEIFQNIPGKVKIL
ncbi:MAG: OB-fold nucleic acid binding domain-containing protein [Nanoarchaeota archaeon]